MNLDDARNLATTLMMEHGLQAQGWTFKFDNAKRRFGECRHGHKTLSLSQSLVILNDEARVGATMLHEIAHALVGPRHGHDAVWKRKAIELGDDGERYYDTATVKPSAPLRVVCPGGHSWPAYRASLRKRSCRKCSGGRFNEAFVLRYERMR